MTTIAVILLLVSGAVGFFFWKTSKAKQLKAPGRPKALYPPDELRIENVQAGGVLRLSAIGPDLDEFDVTVLARHIYRQGNYQWYEFECDRGGEKVWLDMDDDDELELTVCLRKLHLRDLPISKSDLDKMDDDEDGKFSFEEDTYYYEDSDPATYLKNGDQARSEELYFWDFETKSGDKFIGVEKWGDGSYDVSLSGPVKSSQIEVYSLGETDNSGGKQ